MKKFSKLFLSCAAVAALTAAVATAAMAEEVNVSGDVTGTYDTETGKLAITAPADMDADSQATLLVYDAAASATEVTADSVVGIDQAANAAFTKNGLKDKPQVPAEGNTEYTVKLGYYADGTFTVKTGTLRLGSGGVLIGDVDLNGDIDLMDATGVVKHSAKLVLLEGDALLAADADQNNDVDLMDATCIVKYAVKSESGTGSVGETK